MKDRQGRNLPLQEKLLLLLDEIRQKRSVLTHLFSQELNPELMKLFEDAFCGVIREKIEQAQAVGAALPGPAQMTAAFLAGGLANMILCLMREDFASPAREIACCQCELIIRTLDASGVFPEM